ncbi:hypothetical protein AZI86_14130 [Bdellovibrio bacteriovorus]|uniref:MnmC-like methyltransferase domain-containing protein n=1 Tax=Bdellovibrio bacteriovorus TaxID=959 RepID=A0A150WJT1_BDEBC|nr:MnmC family methyltransferase [Bdellovibrio bacteriovorus]KYG63944.1 hypothetical protein AZI86_14130 [Bdellovibrio bacteriovorus]
MKSWAEIGFEIETTADGSPTLRLLESVDPTKYRGESMHHSGGAWAETLLIYGKGAAHVLAVQDSPHFFVLGLGMGYIELAIAREALLAKKEIGLITSYEAVPELRSYFWNWLYNHSENLDADVWQTYEWMAKSVISGTDLSVDELKMKLRPLFATESVINSELTSNFVLSTQYHGIMYDAFSSKTNPLLWEEEFLTRFLSVAAAPISIFSTYACRVSLKSALRATGFEALVQRGFQGKRNSTLGLKGVEKRS